MISSLNFFDTLLIIGAFQGFFLAFVMMKLRVPNKKSNGIIGTLLMANSFFLIGRVLYGSPVINMFPFLILSIDVSLFLYGPLLYLYFKSQIQGQNWNRNWLHILPAMVFILLINPILETAAHGLNYLKFEVSVLNLWNKLELAAIIYNSLYFGLSIAFVKKNLSNRNSLSIVNSLFIKLFGSGLAFWATTYIVRFIPHQSFLSNFQGYNYTWLFLIFGSFIVTYYLIIKNSTFFTDTHRKKYQEINISRSEIKTVITKLYDIMEGEKPYLNPELSLSNLSLLVNVRPNVLSMILNNELNETFYDFINRYRIKTFVEVAIEKSDLLTLEAIANSVGFSSKSAFHKSFKKIHKSTTPKQYILQQRTIKQ